jgi:hypothetical protein
MPASGWNRNQYVIFTCRTLNVEKLELERSLSHPGIAVVPESRRIRGRYGYLKRIYFRLGFAELVVSC